MAVLAVGVLVAFGASVAKPTAANADGIGPAYFLWADGTGENGPCADTVGTYLGEVGIGTYQYNSVYLGHHWVGDHSYYDYRDQGFDTAYKYKGCYNSYPAYRYYGAHKISRSHTSEYECIGETGSCTYRGESYGSWVGGGW
jgi:hypothetical protein